MTALVVSVGARIGVATIVLALVVAVLLGRHLAAAEARDAADETGGAW